MMLIEEETDDGDERLVSDGDVLGEVTTSLGNATRCKHGRRLPHEHQWQTDLTTFERGTPSQFRQCAQAHTDWVNDLQLCNYNQTVVSASSDGTVKAWNPHALTPTDPSTIGTHSDYVRCLTHCREQNWIASGSFDRTIKLWDLSRKNTDPLVTLTAPKASVYALAADPFGQMIASGSPERVVRLWDPRTGKRTGKLVGHTDNIRAILVSEDAKYLLTGSADEVFYSGDRSGLVCRVDVEDSPDLSEGECILLCNDSTEQSRPSSGGINQIVVMDDNLLWTATVDYLCHLSSKMTLTSLLAQTHRHHSDGTSPTYHQKRARL
ncbi:hypothetical protein NLJ89_g10796 [Agrocybe chaxingu]|uniref:Uncharacterized protein n=1 Tax=Agrocybe chaxingu TaxID=84603 RepID=A0A9W8MQK4_9AGAR|nr:hypothetical protein NLJ89_g10796 [Agrocybe chaxingu]